MEQEGNFIIERVQTERFEEALGLSFGAPSRAIDHSVMRLAHRFRANPHVQRAINGAGAQLKAERGQPDLRLERIRQAGRNLSNSPRAEESLKYLEKAVELGREPIDFHWLGSTLHNLGRVREALPHLKKAVRDRGWPADFRFLGLAYWELSKQRKPIKWVNAYWERSMRAKAIKWLTMAAEKGQEGIDYHSTGTCLWQMGNRPEALRYLKLAYAKRGEGVDCHWLGISLCESDCKEEALRYLREAADKRREPVDYHWLGSCLCQLGHKQEALVYLKNAATGRGEAIDCHWYGATLGQLGRWPEALPWLEQALRLRGEPVDHDWLAQARQETCNKFSLIDRSVQVALEGVPQERNSEPMQNDIVGEALTAVEKAKPVRTGSKVGRIDPCPCGSGKKFKQCCGK